MLAQSSYRRHGYAKISKTFKAVLTAVAVMGAIPAHAASMSLTEALNNTDCQFVILSKYEYNGVVIPQGMALQLGGTSPCKDVVVSAADARTNSSISAPLRPVAIGSGGTLSFNDEAMTLYANSFLVKDGGQMLAGSRGAPIQNKITIVMAGNLSVSPAPMAVGSSPIVTTTNETPNFRDITVMDGGRIALFGGHGLSAWPDGINNDPKASPAFINTHQGTNSWSYLAAPAGPASYNDSANVSAPVPSASPTTTLTLAGVVDWSQNDWISVATTSFASHQTEIVQIDTITTVIDPNQGPVTISGATNTAPIIVTATSAPETGETVTITNVAGNTAANGTWTVTKQSDTTFALNAATGNGAYTGGGTVQVEVSQITLSQPLKHYHFGGKAPSPGFFPAGTTQSVVPGGNAIDVSYQSKSFYDGPDQNYGIDERAEVALLSRNIKLTSLAGEAGDANPFTGGHLVAMVSAHGKPAPTLNLVGVEIEKFGQPFVGRYPVHLHHLPQMSVTAATNTSPIVVTSSMVPPDRAMVRISGAQGNSAANGHWMATNTTDTSFSLLGSSGNGALIGTPVWTMDNILVQDVSVHHSYNKCFVAHHTANAQFYNNVCVRTVGQGVYLEDGTDITGNQFMRNHIAGTMAAQSTYSYPRENGSQYWDGDNLQASKTNADWYTINAIPDTSLSGANIGTNPGPDTYHPGGFWITNPGNVFVNNSVAGCQAQGRGYWIITQDQSQESAYPEFTGNRTHGCYNGIDTAPDAINNAYNPAPLVPPSVGNTYPPVLLINGNTSTRSRNRGLWSRSIFMALHNNRFATNPYGVSLAGGGGPEGNLPGYWDLAHANVFAGMSRNNVDRYPACSFTGNNGNNWVQECTDVALLEVGQWGNYPDAKMNIQGYSYYDGPARIENNRFVNFRADPTGIHGNDPAARLLTTIDIAKIAADGPFGQLEGVVNSAPADSAPSVNYKGYAGDPATGWIQSNAQSVPPTQYIKGSIWDNVDFKHQVYDESVNMGVFEDGDKTTVILDMDGRLAGLKVACSSTDAHCTPPPAVSLNNLDYYATDFTVDEPHSRGPNNFLATSLMSPHRYATLNIESVPSPAQAAVPTPFRVEITRDMPAYNDTTYPNLFLNGRGQQPIYEPFVMDRMGYTVRAKTGTENQPSSQSVQAFEPKLLFSYTDPSVKQAGKFFVNRIGVFAPLTDPSNITIYRIRRQWGDKYMGADWPPAPYVPPVASPSCDGTFFTLPSTQQETGWQDCVNRGTNAGHYTGGTTLTQATSWSAFEQNYTHLMNTPTSVATFIANQTYFYDTTSQMLYFYMIEDKPVWQNYAPLGTCDAANYTTGENYLGRIQAIKSFSNPGSVKAALDAACLVSGGTPQRNDLYSCHETGCAAYAVDLTDAGLSTGPLQTITSASNASPIVITTDTAPPTGSQVTIRGVDGNTAANGIWTITNTSSTTFSLNTSTGNGTYTSGGTWTCKTCTAFGPPHPITRTDYNGWNQYKLVYTNPTQQANGLPVTGNPAIGNTPPPTNEADLADLHVPLFNAIPPLGNQITYNFLPLSGAPFPITENFPYRCTQTPPWSPVNARGTYSSPTYPIHHSICSAFDITGATNASPIVITSTVAPPTGTKVKITGITGNTNANGVWTVTNITPTTFSLNGTTGNAVFGSGGSWQID